MTNQARARILVVEDDPEQAMLYKQVLEMSGYDIVTAPDAYTAMAQLATMTFDLILVDWDLPGMKGDELCGQVKGKTPQTRTVLFSNHTNVDEGAQQCGADAWFRKSEGILPLRKIIADLLQSRAA